VALYKIVEEESGPYSFTVAGSSEISGSIIRLTKDSGTWNIQDVGTSAADLQITIANVTATEDDSLLLFAVGNDDQQPFLTSGTDITILQEYDTLDPCLGVYYKLIDTGEESGNFVETDGGNLGSIAIVIQTIATDNPPNWSSNSTNSTSAGTTINHSVFWTDDVGFSGYIFSFDNGNGTFYNDTWVAMDSSNWTNVSKNVNSTGGSTIRWKVYVNDTANNINATDNFSYITTVSCGTLTHSITMNQNLSINGSSCFNITSNDVVLDCNGYVITGNSSATTNGIFAKNVVNVTIQNCIIKGFSWGINATNTNNSLFQNNNISNSTRGFVLANANNNLITSSNFTATTATWDLDSLLLTSNSQNNTINNTFARSGTNAIGFGSGSKWNTFINFSTVDNNYFYAIDANNSFINSTRGGREIYFRSKGNFDSRSECPANLSNITNLGWVYLYNCDNISVTNVNINRGGSSSGGFSLLYIDDGRFTNLSVTNLTWGNALSIGWCDRNNFQDINLTTGDMSISASSVDNNNFNNISMGGYIGFGNTPTGNNFTNIATLGSTSNNYALYSGWSGGTNNRITNATFSQLANPLFVQSHYVNYTFLNVSFNKSKFVATPTYIGNLSVQWYYQTNVSDGTNGINGAIVEVYNNTGSLIANLTTDENGFTISKALEEYRWNNSAFFYQTNYTINVSAAGYIAQSVNLNLTNNTLLGITLVASAEDTCTYTSGNWDVLCSDNCIITSNVDVGGNNISITGTGTFNTTANITNWAKLLIQGTDTTNICHVRTYGGGGFRKA
jgi:hypothetical protein